MAQDRWKRACDHLIRVSDFAHSHLLMEKNRRTVREKGTKSKKGKIIDQKSIGEILDAIIKREHGEIDKELRQAMAAATTVESMERIMDTMVEVSPEAMKVLTIRAQRKGESPQECIDRLLAQELGLKSLRS